MENIKKEKSIKYENTKKNKILLKMYYLWIITFFFL